MKKFTLTSARRYQLKRDAEWAGYRVGFSEDGRFAWIIINDHGDARFMKAIEEYFSWRTYVAYFRLMVEKAREEAAR